MADLLKKHYLTKCGTIVQNSPKSLLP